MIISDYTVPKIKTYKVCNFDYPLQNPYFIINLTYHIEGYNNTQINSIFTVEEHFEGYLIIIPT